MKLPNGDRAVVDIRKLWEYCLDPDHPRGRDKARVFAAIGIRRSVADELRIAILSAAQNREARLSSATPHGQRYVVDFEMRRSLRVVTIRTTWIVRTGEDLPRLTSCYVL